MDGAPVPGVPTGVGNSVGVTLVEGLAEEVGIEVPASDGGGVGPDVDGGPVVGTDVTPVGTTL